MTSCSNIINDLCKSIDNANTELIDNMTNTNMKYDWICIKPNVTYEYFYECLKKDWEKIINNLVNQPNKCSTKMGKLLEMYKYATPERINQIKKIFNDIGDESNTSTKKFGGINIDNLVLDVIASSVIHYKEEQQFVLQHDLIDNMASLGKILIDNCQCQIIDIYKFVIKKYERKYHKKFEGKTKDEVIDIIRSDYNNVKQLLSEQFDSTRFSNMSLRKKGGLGSDFNGNNIELSKFNLIDQVATKFTGMYSFSIENELEKLIPNELGSLKQFFIKVIGEYYNNLHPIIWAQIVKNMAENIFIDLPYTSDELFRFVSKYLLLNSGPFILKILQMIRPVLSPELSKKYNLTKLTYPLMKPDHIELILNKVVHRWDMYKVLDNFSASVGHVCKVVRVDDPSNIFMIKIIKPIAIAQSCWEYKTLHNIFDEGTCEKDFVINMLESNGRELNVNNEINNINKGHEYYTETYSKVFVSGIDATLTTIQNIPQIMNANSWFALTMTLAPGVPLSKLVENNLLNEDTKYRAKLHRCLDLLVYKFFMNLVKNGFYHGDLHAGNIFFSYEQSQMTLIDFGAIGEIDIYANETNVNTLLDIIVMSSFYNYDDILDTMTILLNSKCVETQIDMTSPEYLALKQSLYDHRVNNIQNQEKEKKKTETYENDIFGKKRIADENTPNTVQENQNLPISNRNNSVYTYLEYDHKNIASDGSVIENRNVLPAFTEIMGDSESITFSGVLEKIIKFYALAGVNVAIKFSEFYEFQKAYALLLGVLTKVGYNSYRTGIAIKKAIFNIKNITELRHVGTVVHVLKSYKNEKSKYDNLVSTVGSNIQPTETITNLMTRAMQAEAAIPDEEGMAGGSNSKYVHEDIYYRKYLKYKTKYNQLISN